MLAHPAWSAVLLTMLTAGTGCPAGVNQVYLLLVYLVSASMALLWALPAAQHPGRRIAGSNRDPFSCAPRNARSRGSTAAHAAQAGMRSTHCFCLPVWPVLWRLCVLWSTRQPRGVPCRPGSGGGGRRTRSTRRRRCCATAPRLPSRDGPLRTNTHPYLDPAAPQLGLHGRGALEAPRCAALCWGGLSTSNRIVGPCACMPARRCVRSGLWLQLMESRWAGAAAAAGAGAAIAPRTP